MPTTYLITGGAGNLACQLTFLLAEQGGQVVLFDRAESPVSRTAPGCIYVRGDLTDTAELTAVLQQHRPAAVLHFASLLSGSCEQDRELAWRINMDAAFALFEAALGTGVEKLLFPSSLAAYGGKLPNPLTEDVPQWPDSLYGVTKLAVERLGIYYHARHGLDFRCLRLPVVLSPFAPPGAASAYASRAFVEAVTNGGYACPVNPTTRVSMMYVKDALRAIQGLLEAPAQRLSRRVYNIHAMAPTAQELMDAIAARLPEARMSFAPDPQVAALIESWPVVVEDDTARRDWGWSPKYTLDVLADDFIAELGLEDTTNQAQV